MVLTKKKLKLLSIIKIKISSFDSIGDGNMQNPYCNVIYGPHCIYMYVVDMNNREISNARNKKFRKKRQAVIFFICVHAKQR